MARAVSLPALFIELLVAFPGRPECRCREYFRENGTVPVLLRCCEPVAGRHSGSFLLFVMIEDNGTVLRPGIFSLPAGLRWIVRTPEHVEKLVRGNNSGIKRDTHRFGMAGCPASDLLVAGIRKRAPGLSCDCFRNAINLPERCFNIPEASCGKVAFSNRPICSMYLEVSAALLQLCGVTGKRGRTNKKKRLGYLFPAAQKLSHWGRTKINRKSWSLPALFVTENRAKQMPGSA